MKQENRRYLDAHYGTGEMAAVAVADAWVDCENVLGNAQLPAATIFSYILDKLIIVAKSKGLSEEDVVGELEGVLEDVLVARPEKHGKG